MWLAAKYPDRARLLLLVIPSIVAGTGLATFSGGLLS